MTSTQKEGTTNDNPPGCLQSCFLSGDLGKRLDVLPKGMPQLSKKF